MGYSGARLAPMFTPRTARVTAARMVDHTVDLMLKNVVQNTPIDDSPHPSRPPGTARRSWHKVGYVRPLPTRDVHHAAIQTLDDVCVYLEVGTGFHGPLHRPYIIRPKHPDGMLRFWSRKEGRWVFAKSVLHPGIHAQRPLATGMAITEHELPAALAPDMHEWMAMIEMIGRLESMRR
jgi:hypothetical protein